MMLSDVRDYVESLGISENVYMGKLPDKPEKSIGVYNSKHQRAYHTAIGGSHLEGYGEKPVTILVHWNRSPRSISMLRKPVSYQQRNNGKRGHERDQRLCIFLRIIRQRR
mgnify:CR=1 FL=1